MAAKTPDPVMEVFKDYEGGVQLLAGVVDKLIELGYERYHTDTLRDSLSGKKVRHHYSGGEWRLMVQMPQAIKVGDEPRETTIHWMVDRPYPPVDAVVKAVLEV